MLVVPGNVLGQASKMDLNSCASEEVLNGETVQPGQFQEAIHHTVNM